MWKWGGGWLDQLGFLDFAGVPRADDHHLAGGAGAACDDMGHGGFAPGRRVVDAERAAAFVDAIQTVGRADAGTDLLFPALADFQIGRAHV